MARWVVVVELLVLIYVSQQGGRVYLPIIGNGGPAIAATAWIMPTATPAPPPPYQGR